MKERDENIENRLDHLKNGQPFKVPENYFETFNGRLKARIEQEGKHVRRNNFMLYLKPALGLAASFALIFLLVYVPLVKFMPGKDYMAQQQADSSKINASADATNALVTYFSEGQFLTAFEGMMEYESNTLKSDDIVEYLAVNCSDYEIVRANN